MVATTSASPSASVAVVEVVGASPLMQASGAAGRRKTTVLPRASGLSAARVMPMTGTSVFAQ